MIVGSLLLIVVAVGLLILGLVQGANALLVASIAASLLAAVALIVGGRQAAAARARTARASSRSTGARARAASATRSSAPAYEDDERDDYSRSRTPEREAVGAGAGRSRSSFDDLRPGYAGSSAMDAPPDETAMMAPIRDEEDYPPSIPQQHDADRYGYANDGAYGRPGDAGSPVDTAYDDDDDDDDDWDDEDPEDEPPAQQTSPSDQARIATMHTEVFVIDGRPRYHQRGCVHMLGRESEGLPVSEAYELGFTPCSMCEPDSGLLAAARRV